MLQKVPTYIRIAECDPQAFEDFITDRLLLRGKLPPTPLLSNRHFFFVISFIAVILIYFNRSETISGGRNQDLLGECRVCSAVIYHIKMRNIKIFCSYWLNRNSSKTLKIRILHTEAFYHSI